MGKQQKVQKSSGFSIFRSIHDNCPIQTIRRRMAQRHRTPSLTVQAESSKPTVAHPVKVATVAPPLHPPSDRLVPIQLDHSALQPKTAGHQHPTSRFTENFSDAHIEDYLKRTKPMLRATSSLTNTEAPSTGGSTGKAFVKNETNTDVFTHYIKKAGKKIRTTSSMGEGKWSMGMFNSRKN